MGSQQAQSVQIHSRGNTKKMRAFQTQLAAAHKRPYLAVHEVCMHASKQASKHKARKQISNPPAIFTWLANSTSTLAIMRPT